MTKIIQTTITIKASPSEVWAILTEFDKYPNWNPFIKSITGQAKVGSILIAKIQPPESKEMTFKPRVHVSDENEELKWKGKLLFKGLFDGEHQFLISDNGDGTVSFEQNEKFTGLLVKILPSSMFKNTESGFKEMNAKLKIEAEKKGQY
ncbi:MAG: SRPBCC family protein [Crocinitomicaceae bacterium]